MKANEEHWSVLADGSRRLILEALAARPQAVGELAAQLPISRPAVSQHLKVLRDAKLVDEEPSGTRRVYRLNPAGVIALRDQLDAFWARTLAAYADLVDDEATDEATGGATDERTGHATKQATGSRRPTTPPTSEKEQQQ